LFSEVGGVISSWNDLLNVSGFSNVGETDAASLGTGTLIGSSPNSESGESVEAIPTP